MIENEWFIIINNKEKKNEKTLPDMDGIFHGRRDALLLHDVEKERETDAGEGLFHVAGRESRKALHVEQRQRLRGAGHEHGRRVGVVDDI
jgi:hypothetical protein